MRKVGTKEYRNSKQGGGVLCVIGIKECDRCEKEIEEIEVVEPTKAHRKSGKYYSQYSLCQYCGLYQPKANSKIIL